MQALWGGLDAFDKASDEVMTVGKVDVAAFDAARGCRAGFSSVGVVSGRDVVDGFETSVSGSQSGSGSSLVHPL
jgi:hypothetical protein